jgi:microcystin-dependent protein
MSGFNYLGNSAVPPVGSIMSYMGTSDPDGWVICDGKPRDNNNSKYNSLVALSIGSQGSSSVYTPPNLQGLFLYSSDGNTALGKTGGRSTINLQHNHTQPNGTTSQLDVPNNIVAQMTNSGPRAGIWTWWQTDQPQITLSTNNPSTDNSLNNETSILPPYYIVNYILKY